MPTRRTTGSAVCSNAPKYGPPVRRDAPVGQRPRMGTSGVSDSGVTIRLGSGRARLLRQAQPREVMLCPQYVPRIETRRLQCERNDQGPPGRGLPRAANETKALRSLRRSPLQLARQEWSNRALRAEREIAMNLTAHMARITGRSMDSTVAVVIGTPSATRSLVDPVGKPANRFGGRRQHHGPRRGMSKTTIYQLTDQLHAGHTARVRADEIAATVSAWLAELGVRSPLVDDLARAVRTADWPAAYAIGEHLSVDVTVSPDLR